MFALELAGGIAIGIVVLIFVIAFFGPNGPRD